MTRPKVYFTKEITPESVVKIYEALSVKLPGKTAVKLHSGEEGNQNYIRPEFVKAMVNKVNGTVVECNTAYDGQRNTTEKHLRLLENHGWSKYFDVDLLDAEGPDLELCIPDGLRLKKNYVGKNLVKYDSVLVLSHFKGHPMGGFGGALKQLSIGCASNQGKVNIHSGGATLNQGEFWDKHAEQDDFIEAMAEARTIVFDKTGTLTKAQPTVVDVVPFSDQSRDELLTIAACLEEHFPHSMAKAVVREAARRNLVHEEMHTKVEYLVAHGISSTIAGKKVVIGSYHFIFEDEKAEIPEGKQELFDHLPEEYSHLYMAIDGKLSAVITIEDPLRREASMVIQSLRELGLEKLVMMTGDSERTAAAVAAKVGVDEYYSEVLPEDKARFVEAEKKLGKRVIMIGDGINDSPALSAADVGIAISDGAEIAREIADITISADDLYEIVTLKLLSDSLMRRIHSNYRKIVGFNSALIVLGVAGIIQPTTSAFLHNASTLGISLASMRNLIS